MGFGKIIETASEAEARKIVSEKMNARQAHVKQLVEKYKKSKGLALKKVEEMMDKDSEKTSNLLLFLENTEAKAYECPQLVQNEQLVIARNNINESKKINEAVQAGGAMTQMLPSDIVKIARIGYTNQIAQDVFDTWTMESVKDSLYKLETVYGSTARGSTKDDVVYEKFNGGDYPTTVETYTATASASATQTVAYNASGIVLPARPYFISIYVNGNQVAVDDGNGNLVGKTVASGTVAYNATSGNFISITFDNALTTSDEFTVKYAYDFENEALELAHNGSVLLQLKEYPFVAKYNPLGIEWTRYSEDVMGSKLGLSAKDMLIAGAGDEFRKASDERAIVKGIAASKWANPVEFDTDWASFGADSSYAHAQGVTTAIMNAENLTYNSLGRLADTTNIVCSSMAVAYLSKSNKWTDSTPSSKNGIFKIGEIGGRGVYQAPNALFGSDTNTLYVFGKNMANGNVDAPVSIGNYSIGVTTNPIEFKTFRSEMGITDISDMRINNNKFATRLVLKNLSANS